MYTFIRMCQEDKLVNEVSKRIKCLSSLSNLTTKRNPVNGSVAPLLRTGCVRADRPDSFRCGPPSRRQPRTSPGLGAASRSGVRGPGSARILPNVSNPAQRIKRIKSYKFMPTVKHLNQMIKMFKVSAESKTFQPNV